jgi:hypothetical protein
MLLGVLLFLSPYALADIPQAVPAGDADRFRQAGISTTDDLLAHAATGADRKQLARKTELDVKRVLAYADMADLLRIVGVGPEMVRLFAAAHVHTSKELARQEPGKFFDSLMAANDKQHISQNPPDPKSVAAWIDSAKALPQVLK